MDLSTIHPIALALKGLAPVIGANFDLRSARDAQTDVNKYPRIDYVIHKEGLNEYDHSKKSWRVELVVQIDYLLKDRSLCEYVQEAELLEAQAIQAVQFGLTGYIRTLVQLLIDPSSLGAEFKKEDFIWSDYDFKLVAYPENLYLRKIDANELSGVSGLFVLSLLDKDNSICCVPENAEQLLQLLTPGTVSYRLLKNKIENE